VRREALLEGLGDLAEQLSHGIDEYLIVVAFLLLLLLLLPLSATHNAAHNVS
jgi:hypothetical protein